MSLDLLLDPLARPVIGHRGAAGHAPENTLESFREAMRLGAEVLELDVHLTADGHVVVMHDPRVDRTTDGNGPVAAMTLSQVQALDAGARWSRDGGRTHPWARRGVRVPTLHALLEEFPRVPLMIDAKVAAVAVPLARALERHDAQRRTLVGSFHARNLDPFRGPQWGRIATRSQGIALLARALLWRPSARIDYAALAVPPVLGALPLPMRKLARAAHHHGKPLHVWTVNDAGQAHALWGAGANGLVGDDPALLLAARATAPR
jgi:glycerophosphoryl diester phosphodiesterase